MEAARAVPETTKRPDIDWLLLFAAWLLATLATAGSLFFSQVMGFVPCVLCWYQRICLFPLVVVLGRGLFPFDRAAARYGLPLAAIGFGIAAYHNLIYEGVVPESLAPCAQGVSCSEQHLELFGFLSIPGLSLLGFAVLVGLLILITRRRSP